MNEENRYVRFDWAAKRMLRNKADFVVFEGLISVLLGEKITIVELLESEGDRKSTRLNSSHTDSSRMPSSA